MSEPTKSDNRANLKVPSDAVPHLEELAQRFGKYWGGKPSANALVTAVGRGELDLVPAQKPLPQSAALVTRFIEEQMPFTIAYPDKITGELKTYPILYAELVHQQTGAVRSPHSYLECYCSVPNEKSEIPELSNNRTFRLDRLQGVVASPLEADWRTTGLAFLDVRLRLRGGLAHNYEATAQGEVWGSYDLSEKEWIDATTCDVVWRITSYHWFKRLIMRYGSGCEVIDPPSVRAAISTEVLDMARNYQR